MRYETLMPTATTAIDAMPSDLVENDEARLDSDHLDKATQRTAIIVTLVFWTMHVVVATVRSYLDGHPDLAYYALIRTGVALIGIAFCFLIHLAIKALGKKPFWMRALALAVLAPIAGDATAWVLTLVLDWLQPHDWPAPSPGATLQAVFQWIWFFLAWSAFYLALRYSFEVKTIERRARVIQSLAHSAKLRALRNQINPHFMFNTLNSISSLILDNKPKAAEAMVTHLSDFLRMSLTLDPLESIRLSDEVRMQELYLKVERTRFPDLSAEIVVPEALADALVPPLILQPMVENSVKYGVAGSKRTAHISIAASRDDRRLILRVTDNGLDGCSKSGAGVGLKNVRERLAGLFGDDFSFAAGRASDGGFAVTLSFPLRFAPCDQSGS